MKRSASAKWRGNLKQGSGIINVESGNLSNLPYSFARRFGDEKGTNPEELIAAAHSSCFAMALSAELEEKNIEADLIDVSAIVTLEKLNGGWSIPHIELRVLVTAPGSDRQLISVAAQTAKVECPISKLLKATITMDLQFEDEQQVGLH